MEQEEWRKKLAHLIANYEEGLYLAEEVVSIVMELLNPENIDDLWKELHNWTKIKVITQLQSFDERDQIVCFGHADPNTVKRKNIFVKKWLEDNSLM